jgi:hypothetical protein
MEVVREAVSYGSLGFALANTFRDRQQFQEKERMEWKQHEDEVKLAEEQHEEEERLAKQIYLVDKFSEIEQHFQQLNADLLAAAKESERDMWDQRNQQFSNIVVATTIIMTGLVTVLVQGVLPPGCSEFIKIAYAIANSFSMGLLIICAVLSLEIIIRASNFMFNRTREYSVGVQDAIRTTEKMMKQIRFRKDFEDASIDRPEALRLFVGMSEAQIEEEFKNHEEEVRKYLRKRQKIIEKASEAIYSDEGDNETFGSNNENFSHFWRKHCRTYSHYAILVFYAGSGFLVIATMICMWSYFQVKWNCEPAAHIAIGIMSASLVICSFVVTYLRYCDVDYLLFKRAFEWKVKQDVKRLAGRGVAMVDGVDIPLERAVSGGTHHRRYQPSL